MAKKQTKKTTKNNKTQIRRRCMLCLTYMVWELIYQIWDQQNANRVEQKKKKKRVRSSSAFFNYSHLGLKRP